MNDFLIADLAREHTARLARAAAAERLAKQAERRSGEPLRHGRRPRTRPRHD